MKDCASVLQEVKKKGSIEIQRGTKVIWPLQGGRIGTLDMSKTINEFPGRSVYATNGPTIAYIDRGRFYIMPRTRDNEVVLEKCGFEKEDFYVPCSSGDLPKSHNLAEKWQKLREIAEKSYADDFVEECLEYCDAHQIHAISERILEQCLEIPEEGMKICTANGVEFTYYPILETFFLNEAASQKLGRYCIDGDTMVFVYRNGKTYLAKAVQRVLYELNKAGFQTTKTFPVPSTLKQEQIVDPVLKHQFGRMVAYAATC